MKLVKLKLAKDNCTACGACHAVCPMGVKFDESPEDQDCITCMKCMTEACRFDAIYLEVGGVPISTGRTVPGPVVLEQMVNR